MQLTTSLLTLALTLPLSLAQSSSSHSSSTSSHSSSSHSSSTSSHSSSSHSSSTSSHSSYSPHPTSHAIKVQVGKGGKLVYHPQNVTASVGSTVEFIFHPKNHTVTQASFDKPCHPLAGGFSSSYVPLNYSDTATFKVKINDTEPIWVYSGQSIGNECGQGMVMAINAPATGTTNLDAYIALSKTIKDTSIPPGGPVGGNLTHHHHGHHHHHKQNSTSTHHSSQTSASPTSAHLTTYTSNSHTYMTMVTPTVARTGVKAGASTDKPATTNGAPGRMAGGRALAALVVAAAGLAVLL